MATKYFRLDSLTVIDKAIEELDEKVEEKKQQLNQNFQHLHQMLEERENTLLAELDDISTDFTAKLTEMREYLERLIQLSEETEDTSPELSDIQSELDRVTSEKIIFPKVTFTCNIRAIKLALAKCYIPKPLEPDTPPNPPVWHGVTKGEGEEELNTVTAICIEPKSQLICVGDYGTTCRIQCFTSEGKYHSTLVNQHLYYIHAMKAHGQYIYVATTDYKGFGKPGYLVKLSGENTLRRQNTEIMVYGLFIEGENLYTCSQNSLTVHLYDLNLHPINEIELQAVSFDESTHPSDIIINNQQMFVLFRYFGKPNHEDQIQVFQLDGALIRSLVTGEHIRHARYFCQDADDNILVSNRFGHSIRIFSPDGVLINSIGSKGKAEPGELWQPGGIEVDSQGRIIIVDRKDSNKLQAFKYS